MMQNPMVQQMMQQMLNDPQALEQVRAVCLYACCGHLRANMIESVYFLFV